MFKPGSLIYNRTLRSWIYGGIRLADTPWNRWILEHDVYRMSPKERVEFTPRYPLHPTPSLIPYLKETLYSGAYNGLSLLIKVKGGEEIYRIWVEEKIIPPRDIELFVKTAKYIVQFTIVPPVKLFEMFLPSLNEEQSSHVIHDVAEYLPHNEGARSLFKWVDDRISNKRQRIDFGMAKLIGRFISFPDLRRGTIDLIIERRKV